MTLASSLQELKIRTIIFLGVVATTAAAYYAPEATVAVAGWWLKNPVQANEVTGGIIEGISNSPESSFLKPSNVKGLNIILVNYKD